MPATLLSRDFHEAKAWQAYLRKLANGKDNTLAELVPPAYVGDTPAARLAAYAEDMARKVRVAWPTEVITRRLQTSDLRMDQASGAASTALTADVVTVLQRASGLGFQLGTTPASPFLRDNHDTLFAGMPGAEAEASRQAVLKLQRLYQITPSDHSMQVLLDAGVGSAHAVSGYDLAGFVAHYGTALGGDEVARSVYRKAYQVNAIGYSVYGAAAMVHSSVPMFGVRQ